MSELKLSPPSPERPRGETEPALQARAPSRALAALRHAISQPLAVIQGFSELIAGGDLSQEEMREYAALIFTEAVQLAEIVARTRDG